MDINREGHKKKYQIKPRQKNEKLNKKFFLILIQCQHNEKKKIKRILNFLQISTSIVLLNIFVSLSYLFCIIRYITATEWANEFGGKVSNRETKNPYQPLPFNCCALSLIPFENPVCTDKGNIYDVKYIFPFIKKYGVDPVTGEKLSTRDLFPLYFTKNSHGEFECPVFYFIYLLLLKLYLRVFFLLFISFELLFIQKTHLFNYLLYILFTNI